ncbi:MAG: hypothetical protein ACTSVI_00020 [Promethearchaeota archaeon]
MSPKSISEVSIEEFDAYTNNSFGIAIYEQEEEPDKYDCQFIFENKSNYIVRLVNADVDDEKDENIMYVDVDPKDIPHCQQAQVGRVNHGNTCHKTDNSQNSRQKSSFSLFLIIK